MPENMDQHSSNSWDPILFTNADDSMFDRLHQHSFTEADNSMTEDLDQHSIIKGDNFMPENLDVFSMQTFLRGLIYVR
jgi:hypothetical protein